MDSLKRSDLERYNGIYLTYSIHMVSTDMYYVGYTDEVINRVFNSFYGHLGSLDTDNMDYIHVVMRSNPISDFEFIIEELHKSEEFALSSERRLVIEHDSFNNGFNMTNNGFGGTGGRIRVFNSKTKDEKFIKPNELEYFSSLGYKKGSNRIVVSPPEGSEYEFKFKRVKREDLRKYLDKGFTIGSSSLSTTKGNVFVYRDNEQLSIPRDELNRYKELGYVEGFMPNQGKSHYFNQLTGEIRTFSETDKIPSEFIKGKCKYGGLYKMSNGINTKKVKFEETSNLLEKGYKFIN